MSIAKDFKTQFVRDLIRLLVKKKVTQSDLARRMGTSRAVVHRLLQPGDTGLTLATMAKAADALGASIKLRLA